MRHGQQFFAESVAACRLLGRRGLLLTRFAEQVPASLPEGVEMVMPGDNVEMTVELIAPIAMEEGLRFAIREGGRTVGAGRVTKILK